MSRKRMSRSWVIVLLLLAVVVSVSSMAVVVTSPATPEPEPETAKAETSQPAPDPAPVEAPKPEPTPPPAPKPAPEPKPEPPEPVDRLLKARMQANETAAVATSRNVCSAQAVFQASAMVDEDSDGSGEFGTFGEMSGGATLRGSNRRIIPPVLSRAFKAPDQFGRVERAGYYYAIYLPGSGGRPEGEQPTGGFVANIADADLAETTWCMYAWPKEYGKTGTRTFMVNQTGDVVSTDCHRYTGSNGPAPDAAFRPDARTSGTIVGNQAIGTAGNDGQPWKQVN